MVYELAQFSFRVTDVFQLTSTVSGHVGLPQVIATIWFWPSKRMHGHFVKGHWSTDIEEYTTEREQLFQHLE
jgi:hypothetical protein